MASMRPSDITDGIRRRAAVPQGELRTEPGFNEAVGYYRRNPMICLSHDTDHAYASMRPSDITDGILGCACHPRRPPPCFNEAVGYYRRNPCTLTFNSITAAVLQ